MTDEAYAERALLPEGLRDDLPPWAEYEAAMVDRLMAIFARHGYERVAPPLVEFEESLLAAAGPKAAPSMFRLLDPVSRRMMAVRSDMTLQVARIATTRLAAAPRPLRLSYAGHVLRVKGSQLRPSRQFRQAGVELIGPDAVMPDLEVILLAVEALGALGIRGLSVDLVSPTLVPAIADMLSLPPEAVAEACRALDAKDIGALAAFEGRAAGLFAALMRVAGPAEAATERLMGLALEGRAARLRARYVALVRSLQKRAGDLAVTLDPGEVRGFEYQTGVGFAFFARGERGELGRGGRYTVRHADGREESAVGFSIFLDSLLRAAPPPEPAERVYCPFGSDEAAAGLRAEGRRTVAGLTPETDVRAEARRLGCTHILEAGGTVPLKE